MNWKSFACGFVAGIALLGVLAYLWLAPSTPWWPDRHKEKGVEAEAADGGPFLVTVPKSSNGRGEAVLYPANGERPLLFSAGRELIIDDVKKLLPVSYDSTGERFPSYSIPDLVGGPAFTYEQLTAFFKKIDPEQEVR